MAEINGDPKPNSPGEARFQELLWVHGMLRRDLAAVSVEGSLRPCLPQLSRAQ